MRWRNHAGGYGIVTIALHWAIAALVFGLFGLGLYMVTLTYYDPLYRTLPQWHKDLGVVLVVLVLVRLVWRRLSPPPASLAHRPIERRAATLTHGLLYLLPLVIAVFGYLISTADGRALTIWGGSVSLPATVTGLDNQEDLAGEIHLWLAWALIGLVVVHVLGALKHHLFDRDRTLLRMLGRG